MNASKSNGVIMIIVIGLVLLGPLAALFWSCVSNDVSLRQALSELPGVFHSTPNNPTAVSTTRDLPSAIKIPQNVSTPTTPSRVTEEIQIEALKIYQESSFACIDVQIFNNSDQFISYYEIDANIYNTGNEYLGKSFCNGSNLRPHQSVTESITFSDVQAADINSWKPQIGKIENQNGDDVTTDFQLIQQQQ